VYGGFARWTYGADPRQSPTKDEVLDDFTLYWENQGHTPTSATAQKSGQISLPVAITVFPYESYRAPETWARRAYPHLIYFHEVDKGGHFAAWEEPELFSAEVRTAFSSLR
jgi:pimeloyl-ACP methyl ester carboxylesterase